MILTITANAALDRVMVIPAFEPERRMLASRCSDYVGGKGFDVSVALAGLGVESLAMGIVAGENGRRLEFLLHGYGVAHSLTWVNGETRLAHIIVESEHRRHSHIITPGYRLSAADCQLFFSRLRSRVWEADWVAACGSLPPGAEADFYRSVVQIAHQAGVPIIVDCHGEPALLALEAIPAVLKMNATEFSATFGLDKAILTDSQALLAAMKRVQSSYPGTALVVTCGAAGLLAICPQGVLQVSIPPLIPVSAAGAGDCATAALAWRLSLGEGWSEALRWAGAAGAAGVLTEGTGEVRLEDVLRLLPQVICL
jgi:1-phosphofructokinase family hexose kinase